MRLPSLAFADLLDGYTGLKGLVAASHEGRTWYDSPNCWARHGSGYVNLLSAITADEVIVSNYMPSAHSAESLAFVVSRLM